jgi:hypothetical protein
LSYDCLLIALMFRLLLKKNNRKKGKRTFFDLAKV